MIPMPMPTYRQDADHCWRLIFDKPLLDWLQAMKLKKIPLPVIAEMLDSDIDDLLDDFEFYRMDLAGLPINGAAAGFDPG